MNKMCTWRWVLFTGVFLILLGIVPVLGADTYSVEVRSREGGTQENIAYNISPQQPKAGEKVTVTVTTTRNNYAPSKVNFYDTTNWKPTDIPGTSIIRDYDKPNQFSFVMPAQNVALQLVCQKERDVWEVRYFEPNIGHATPASLDGSIPAKPYTCSQKPLSASSNSLFSCRDGIEGYLYKFEGGGEYGRVDTSGEYLTYTPNAAASAAGSVTICLKAWSGGGVSGELKFKVLVDPVPDPAKSRETGLLSLSYSLDGGTGVPIALTEGMTEYQVTLPYDTEIGRDIKLTGVPKHTAAVTESKDTTTDYHPSKASLKVTAEDPYATAEYTVIFQVAPPEVAPYVEIDGKEYEDGDTVYLGETEMKRVFINHGSGEIGANSLWYYSSPYQSLEGSAGSMTGIYPNTQAIWLLKWDKPQSTKLYFMFYKERVTQDFEDLTPVKTITLNLELKRNNTPVYTVTFDSQGGTHLNSMAVVRGGKVYCPDNPVRDGFIFTGWYKEPEAAVQWDFAEDAVWEDTTLYAGWKPQETPEPTPTPAPGPEHQKPEAPRLRLETNTTRTITLTWETVPNADGYVLYGYDKGDLKEITQRLILKMRRTEITLQYQQGTPRSFLLRAYRNIDGKNIYSKISNQIVTATKPEPAVIKSAVPGKGTVRVTLRGVPEGAAGYAYCASTDGKTYKIIAKGPKMPYTMKGLKKGVNYIKVRSYVRDFNGKSVYGDWSPNVKVKVG